MAWDCVLASLIYRHLSKFPSTTCCRGYFCFDKISVLQKNCKKSTKSYNLRSLCLHFCLIYALVHVLLETWCPFTPKHCSAHFPARHSPTEHSSVNTVRKLSTSSATIGEENGNPLQRSCLENPRDGGDWWAAVYGVTQSRTRLKRLSSNSSSAIIYFINSSQNILTFFFLPWVQDCIQDNVQNLVVNLFIFLYSGTLLQLFFLCLDLNILKEYEPVIL